MEQKRKPSETAIATASLRAMGCYEPDERIRCGDHLAELFLPDEKRIPLKNPDFRREIKKMIPEGLFEYVLARTHYFDNEFSNALKNCIPQIVILGAGYDSRPYRFEPLIGDTRIYEVDAPSTQEVKKYILMENSIQINHNVFYTDVDFEKDDLSGALSGSGFSSLLPTLFLWEGVTFYLKPETVGNMLKLLKKISALKSTLCFDYQNLEKGNGLIDNGLQEEKIHFGIETGTIETYLEYYGYRVSEILNADTMSERFLTCSDESSFGRIDPKMNIVKSEMID